MALSKTTQINSNNFSFGHLRESTKYESFSPCNQNGRTLVIGKTNCVCVCVSEERERERWLSFFLPISLRRVYWRINNNHRHPRTGHPPFIFLPPQTSTSPPSLWWLSSNPLLLLLPLGLTSRLLLLMAQQHRISSRGMTSTSTLV